MTTETVIAKIQLRRGDFDDLPVLDEAELGYATDANRLFIGNKKFTFRGDGVTREFFLRDASIIPSQIRVAIDDEIVYDTDIMAEGLHASAPGVSPEEINYVQTIEGSKILFARAPGSESEISVYCNSEIKVNKQHPEKIAVMLDVTGDVMQNTNISWDVLRFNTAKMTYSYKAGEELVIGEALFITNGPGPNPTIKVRNSATDDFITFMGVIDENDRFHVTYMNNTAPANLFYSLELWNTI
jgi:hypothetical protein